MLNKLLIGIVLTVLAFTSGLSSANSLPLTGKTETVRLPVVKVFSAKDGRAIFRAYVVKWKDQEVIVDDNLARTNYKEGDVIPVIVMNNNHPNKEADHDLLHFAVGADFR